MVALTNDPEFQRLKRLADRYRKRGYVVHIYPDDSQLPSFLKGQDVDLIAEGPEQNIVVEVKSARTRTAKIQQLADALEGRKGWRLDLDVVSSPSTPATALGRARPLSRGEIVRQITEARRLALEAVQPAAHLLAWSIAEALMREALAENGISPQNNLPWAMPKQLYSAGLINKASYDILHRAGELRNVVAHGYSLPGEPRFNTESLLRISERFLQEARSRN